MRTLFEGIGSLSLFTIAMILVLFTACCCGFFFLAALGAGGY